LPFNSQIALFALVNYTLLCKIR